MAEHLLFQQLSGQLVGHLQPYEHIEALETQGQRGMRCQHSDRLHRENDHGY